MIENTKCECGHQNHIGTLLCESCGKPLAATEETELLEMRYDGIARRSQKANPKWLDRIWNFFSSVKIAVMLILITLLGSILGTILPQENTFINMDPAVYYKDTYGTFGYIYYLFGLTDTYNSWWYRLLLVMIGASLVICSLDRVLPLYRALSKQKIRKHLRFLTGQKVVFKATLPTSIKPDEWIGQLAPHLKKRGYRVHTEDSALLAEKHRFSRWGPYINHIGLIIFLLAVLMRGIPGWYMDQYIGFLEGEIRPIPGTHYYLKNEKFTVEFYDQTELSKTFQEQGRMMAKLYETQAVLYECTVNCSDLKDEQNFKVVKRHAIIVNKPLTYKGLHAYQFDYHETPQLISVNASLKDKQSGEVYGQVLLQMNDPQQLYTAGPYNLRLKGYFPDFTLGEQGPITQTNEPNAPAFVFLISGPGLADSGDIYIYFPREIDKMAFSQDKLNGELAEKFDLSVQSMQEDVKIANYTSFLNIRVDRALPYIFSGAILFMIGVVMGLYWQHRRIWLRFDEGNQLTLGAHTNKNWYGLRADMIKVCGQMGLETDHQSLGNGVKKQ